MGSLGQNQGDGEEKQGALKKTDSRRYMEGSLISSVASYVLAWAQRTSFRLSCVETFFNSLGEKRCEPTGVATLLHQC